MVALFAAYLTHASPQLHQPNDVRIELLQLFRRNRKHDLQQSSTFRIFLLPSHYIWTAPAINNMGTLTDILAVLRRERAQLFAKYGLKSMAVFGSATRDDFRPDSDVDIMVEFDRPVAFEFIYLA